MTYAATSDRPPWPQGPLLSLSPSPAVIDLGDHPALSGPSHTPSTAAAFKGEPATPIVPLQSTSTRANSDPYYALDSSASHDRSKKRKIERACDFCRRRKTKCDGPKMNGYTCTNCTQNSRECTYNEASKPRGPPKAYVNGLEDRLERLEALLRRLRPEIYFSQQFGPPIPRGAWKNESPPRTKPASHAPLIPRLPTTSSLQSSSLIPPAPLLASGVGVPGHSGGPVTIAISNSLPNTSVSAKPSRDSLQQLKKQASAPVFSDYDEQSSGSSSESEDYGELSLIRGLQSVSLGSTKPLEGSDPRALTDSQWRFHGKSSSFKLISAARKFQQLHMNEIAKSSADGRSPSGSPQAMGNFRRPQFWTSPSWETDTSDSGPKFSGTLKNHWPDLDLAERLIDMYFQVMNAHFPLLHRPTFMKQWYDRLYERDFWYACLCMSLFGVASRWCHDVRVLIYTGDMKTPPDESDPIWNSAGWKYIAVAIEFQRSSYNVTLPPSLFEVQSYHNIGLFLRGTSVYMDAWTFVSIGLRKAQDIGAHRKSVYGPVPTIEGELWKRAYWHLVSFDAISSMILGRPCASRDEDFDLDMPLEVDDDYWENDDPKLAFQQPKGKPSTVSAFIAWIKLTRIAAHALRTLYALEKSKAPLGLVGPRWREETVERLNDAMIDWLDAIPEHLRWSPGIKDPVFASQSATLITTYYMVQIVAHRPFIPMPTAHTLGGFNRKHNLAVRPDFPWNCLAICTNAAKATSEIVESYAHNVDQKNFASMANCCYIAAGVLLVHIWILKSMERAGVVPESGGKRASEERMRDVTGTLTKLMARLEEVAPKMDVAAMWLAEIKESLPTYDIQSDAPAPSEGRQRHMDTKPDRTATEVQSSVPIVPSQHYQHIAPAPEPRSRTQSRPDRSALTLSTSPATIKPPPPASTHHQTQPPQAASSYDYPPPERATSAYRGQPTPQAQFPTSAVRRHSENINLNTPSTPQLYSSISSATGSSASPYTPVHVWETRRTPPEPQVLHYPAAPTSSSRSASASASTSSLAHAVLDAPRPLRQEPYIQSLRHYSLPETSAVGGTEEVPLPPWFVFQGAQASPMYRFYAEGVKAEEGQGQHGQRGYGGGGGETTPAILPPFYASASMPGQGSGQSGWEYQQGSGQGSSGMYGQGGQAYQRY